MRRDKNQQNDLQFFKKGISNDAAQYLDVIGIYLDAAKDNPELFEDMAVDIARAVLDDYLMRQKPSSTF